jgi:hypothetical protein
MISIRLMRVSVEALCGGGTESGCVAAVMARRRWRRLECRPCMANPPLSGHCIELTVSVRRDPAVRHLEPGAARLARREPVFRVCPAPGQAAGVAVFEASGGFTSCSLGVIAASSPAGQNCPSFRPVKRRETGVLWNHHAGDRSRPAWASCPRPRRHSVECYRKGWGSCMIRWPTVPSGPRLILRGNRTSARCREPARGARLDGGESDEVPATGTPGRRRGLPNLSRSAAA